MVDLRDNLTAGRLEMHEGGAVVFADYRREGRRLMIDHVEAPASLRGTGAAGRFMQALVSHAQAAGETIVPICGYAATWLSRHERDSSPPA